MGPILYFGLKHLSKNKTIKSEKMSNKTTAFIISEYLTDTETRAAYLTFATETPTAFVSQLKNVVESVGYSKVADELNLTEDMLERYLDHGLTVDMFLKILKACDLTMIFK